MDRAMEHYIGQNVFEIASVLRSGFYVVLKKYKKRSPKESNPWRIILYYDKAYTIVEIG